MIKTQTKLLALALIGLFPIFSLPIDAAVIAQWTFETSQPNNNGPFAPEIGNGSGTINTGGVVSSPIGNGSNHSFSSTDWDTGDYFEFTISTLGQADILVTWDQTGNSTGPKNFELRYSLNGSSFNYFSNTAIATDGNDPYVWNNSTPRPQTSFFADFTGITEVNNAATVYFRVVETGQASLGGGTVAINGSSRIDNFTVQSSAVPEPSTWSAVIFGLLGTVFLARRRVRALLQ